MNGANPDWFETCVDRLTSDGTQRVWSVLVTIFGDLAQDETDQISGALVTALTSLAGIKAEATRVALHRLRKEGWIESTRIGRSSVHRLTEYGRQQSAAAAPRIYGHASSRPTVWHVLIANNADTSRKELADLMLIGDYISLNSTTVLSPGPMPQGLEDLLGVESDKISVPTWLRELCGPESLKGALDRFWKAMQFVEQNLPSGVVIDPLRTAVLRMLIVHKWRRIVLRHPDLPANFLPEDWKAPACREAVSRLLDSLPRPGLAELETWVSG